MSLSTRAERSTKVSGMPNMAYTMQNIFPSLDSGVTFPYPIVVTIVVEKKRDWPKLQFGSPETLLAAETPRLLAFTTSWIKFSKALSETQLLSILKSLMTA